jgi:hypothetical protein
MKKVKWTLTACEANRVLPNGNGAASVLATGFLLDNLYDGSVSTYAQKVIDHELKPVFGDTFSRVSVLSGGYQDPSGPARTAVEGTNIELCAQVVVKSLVQPDAASFLREFGHGTVEGSSNEVTLRTNVKFPDVVTPGGKTGNSHGSKSGQSRNRSGFHFKLLRHAHDEYIPVNAETGYCAQEKTSDKYKSGELPQWLAASYQTAVGCVRTEMVYHELLAKEQGMESNTKFH